MELDYHFTREHILTDTHLLQFLSDRSTSRCLYEKPSQNLLLSSRGLHLSCLLKCRLMSCLSYSTPFNFIWNQNKYSDCKLYLTPQNNIWEWFESSSVLYGIICICQSCKWAAEVKKLSVLPLVHNDAQYFCRSLCLLSCTGPVFVRRSLQTTEAVKRVEQYSK